MTFSYRRSRLVAFLALKIRTESRVVVKDTTRSRWSAVRPILQSAIAAGATHLITGDLRDFGALLGKSISGVRVETPAEFLRQQAKKSS